MKLQACSAEGFFMHSHSRSSSSVAVMGEGFRRSFPVEHDLPPAMSALMARLAALESRPESAAIGSGKIRSAENLAQAADGVARHLPLPSRRAPETISAPQAGIRDDRLHHQ
jgi:hypothetical protein